MNVFTLRGFWFACIVVGVWWAYIVAKTLRPVVLRDPSLSAAARSLSLGVGLTLSVPPAIIGCQQIAGNLSRWDYIYSSNANNPWVVSAWLVVAAWHAFILFWLSSGNAAAALSRFGSVLPEWLQKPLRLQVLLSVAAVISLVGYVVKVLRDGSTTPAV